MNLLSIFVQTVDNNCKNMVKYYCIIVASEHFLPIFPFKIYIDSIDA